ncbi:MAG: TauD/TfdA family dioxygenase [Pseudomonadales bacterium]
MGLERAAPDGWREMLGALGATAAAGDVCAMDINELTRALNQYQVLVFRDQSLTPLELAEFASQFGELDVYPHAEPLAESPHVVAVVKNPEDSSNFGGAWHTDTSYMLRPPKITMLYAVEVPDARGDTMFADTYRAFSGLSAGLQLCLENLRAVYTAELVHSSSGAYASVTGQGVKARASDRVTTAEHPAVRVHPETGRKALYTSLIHTERFVGMTRPESLALLEYLQAAIVSAENCMRLKWRPGTLTVWDNRCVQHYPLNDYPGERRVMHRVIVKGDTPVGVAGAA